MPTATLPAHIDLGEVEASEAPATSPPSRRGPVLAMAAGLVAIALAATALVVGADRSRPSIAPAPAPATGPATPVDPLAITLSARDVSVVSQVYEPGEDSGWHSHSGIHAVAILSGTLTVYDGECQARTFEPGQPYIGGQEVHLVRNETTAPVVMAVTYLRPSSGHTSTRPASAPSGCPAGR